MCRVVNEDLKRMLPQNLAGFLQTIVRNVEAPVDTRKKAQGLLGEWVAGFEHLKTPQQKERAKGSWKSRTVKLLSDNFAYFT